MAEAHQAVSYSELIKREHTEANHDKEVLQLVWQSGLRSWKKRFARFKRKIRNGVYPAHLESLFIIIAIVMTLRFSTQKVPYDLDTFVVETLPKSTIGWQVVACFLAGFIYWILICLMMRYVLKILLMYKGFMFETRGKGISMMTKVWAVLVKFLVKWNTPSLYSFQGSLPHLPLPSVKDTMTRYLRSVRPLLDDENFARVQKEAQEFQNGIGKKLQRYLILKSWWASNYVSDWWEEYVYLRGRSPLMVNSNYYGSDCIILPTKNQAARAANTCYLVLQHKRRIERQELKPIMVQGMVPLCSWQYERTFGTVRVPGIETDKIVHYENIKHIVVLHKGCYYKMMFQSNGRHLNALEMQNQLEHIMSSNEKSSQAENHLASLTAWDRTKWAKAREKYFATGVNKLSLHDIESAAFVLALDEEPYKFDMNSSPVEYGYYGQQLLHGKGCDRWFDKSFTVCVGSNAKMGVNGEHSWADAPILSQCFEEFLIDDGKCYDEQGNLKGKMEILPPKPARLQWDFTDIQFVTTIEKAYEDSQKIINDVDHQILIHDAFGKGFIKTCHMSPDAYLQMALQLAYYRDYGKFSLTYEASMTRLFREGRTETVRSCTIESAAWVRSMEDKSSNIKERIRLLNEACKRHQVGYLDAMCGRGVDRHLFCLYVVSKYLEVESPFLKEVINEPWRLSTSQTPIGQTPKTEVKNNPGFISASGGFGPVAYDGYGVSYIFSGDDVIFFHVSSFKGSNSTSTTRFVQGISRAMNDIKLLFEDDKITRKKIEESFI